MKELLASIDVGAHSARLLIAELSGSGKYEPLEDLEIPVPLGGDVFRTGKISNASFTVLCGVLRNFRRKMEEYRIRNYRAIATSAIREAENAEVFLERMAFLTGIRIQIFTGADEARLGYLAMKHTLPESFRLDDKKILHAEIGTGACQVTAYDYGVMRFTETVRLGTLRAAEQLAETGARTARISALRPMIETAFGEMSSLARTLDCSTLIVTGASSRAMISLRKTRGNARETVELKPAAFREIFRKAAETDAEKLCELCHLRPDLAEAVLPCCLMIDNLCRITGAASILIPGISTKYALLEDFIRMNNPQDDPFEEQIFGAASLTAARYGCDSVLAGNTAELAEELFRKLSPLHGMDHRSLVLLKVAALLHKVGLFISNQAYHKHSSYIILNTEIPGLGMHERLLTSLIARYHRKSFPKMQHPDFAALPIGERSLVTRLAALLRIACGLAQNLPPGGKFTVKIAPDLVRIQIPGGLRMTAAGKVDASLFEYAFAVRLVLS